jgi:hypothetical protein
MLRRSVERISLVIGGALIGIIGYEKLQPRLPAPLPSRSKSASIMQESRNLGEFKVKRVNIL